ncbi:hypothetical protein [Dactylosporangium sp. CA-233914]|uniref:hypothetical protein n=1 Tax=Dactylosporangium sp. CA-233914 TaxID=3239934 RepID=UPI003D89E92A
MTPLPCFAPHSSTDIVARGFDPQLMPAWPQRLATRGRRLLRRASGPDGSGPPTEGTTA